MANHPMLELMAFGISINLSTRMLLKKEIKLDWYKVLLQKLVLYSKESRETMLDFTCA